MEEEVKIFPEYEVNFSTNISALRQQGNSEDEVVSKSSLMIQQLTENKKAGKVTLSMLPIKPSDLLALAKYFQQRAQLPQYQVIQSVNLTGISMKPALMRVVAEELLDDNKYQQLRWLGLSQTGLTSVAPVRKAKKVPNQPQMREREPEKEKKQEKDVVTILAEGLQNNSTLRYLHLSKNPKLTSDALNKLLNSLYQHPQIHLIVYNSNRLTMDHCRVLGEYFGRMPNPTLPRITLESCGINDEMMGEICKGIRLNSILRHLQASKNEISDDGVRFLCNALRRKSLGIENDEDVARQVAAAIPPSAMNLLNLSGNNISALSGGYLAEMVAGSYHMEYLDLSFNAQFGDDGVNALCHGLISNESIMSLRLGSCNLTDNCCDLLGQVLSTHSNLANLELRLNSNITGTGMSSLCKGMEHNSHLRYLNLEGLNKLGKTGGVALRRGLQGHVSTTIGKMKFLKNLLSEYNCADDEESEKIELPEDIINFLIEWVGYQCVQTLSVINCYPNTSDEGIDDLVICVSNLRSEHNHKLEINW